VLPIVIVVFVSFTKWSGTSYNFGSLSFANYAKIFREAEYYRVILNTLLMGGIIIVLNLAIGFVVGYWMSGAGKLIGFYRVVWYIPVVVSIAVVSLILNTIINPATGAMNTFLTRIGVAPVEWQQSVFWMYFWVILLVIWKGLGGVLILFVAGFSSIPKEMLEAADIDGARGVVRMVKIVIPSVRNMIVFVLITSLIGVFGIFEPVLLVSGGAPAGKTNVIMFQIYNEAFQNFNMGMSSAISVVVLLLTMGLSIANVRLLNNQQ